MLVELFAAVTLGWAPLPPVEHINNKTVKVEFVEDANTIAACGVSSDPTRKIVACAGVGEKWMIMPNPCMFPYDEYARVLCHELGHNNGWEANHPNPR